MHLLVAAGEAYVRPRSGRNPVIAFNLMQRDGRFYDRYALERSLWQLLRESCPTC